MLKKFRPLAVATVLLCGATAVAASDLPLPTPNQQGDYMRAHHPYWMVVDPDPNGLNCRMGEYSYDEIIRSSYDGNSDVFEFFNWPVVGTFSQGDRFQIHLGPAGFGRITDTRGKPWLYVTRTDANGAPSNCFVRGNTQFVIPVEPRQR